jgi:peptidoglycan hydrolase CwlO-like protein
VTSHPRRLALLALAVIVLAALVTPTADSAPGAADPRKERQEARAKQAEVAADIDALRASDAELQASLSALEADVANQEARLADARKAAEAAEQAQAEAEAELQQAQDEVAALRQSMRDVAVDSYVHPPGQGDDDTLMTEDINDVPVKRALLDSKSSQADDVLDQYRAAQEDLEAKRTTAEAAAGDARARAGEAESQLATLEESRGRQQALANEVDDRIGAALSESAALEQLDQQLSGEIARQQEALAAQVRAAAPAPRSSGGSSGGGPAPVVGPTEGIVSVRGIQVAASIAGQLGSMLAAADAAGISLSGGGYRDPSGQIAVRRANCGPTNYDIYEKPASQCSPPTAKPGQSMHERGLAIDFTHNGGLIRSRDSQAFRWLAANASSYGFANLPSEPWHWSTNGN